MNIEKALLKIDGQLKTVIMTQNTETEYPENAAVVLLDLINSDCKEELTLVTAGCGRAVAYLARLLNVKAIYALKMSEEATDILKESNISYFYQDRVKLLMNSSDSDLDLYDKAIISVENSNEAYRILNKTIADMRVKAFWETHKNGALNYTRIVDISNGRTAVSSLYDSYGASDSRLPRKKDRMIGVDQFGMPVAILENIEINVTPLKSIDEELAGKEGLSLGEWEEHYVPLLYEESEKIGIPASDDIWVLFEIFKAGN